MAGRPNGQYQQWMSDVVALFEQIRSLSGTVREEHFETVLMNALEKKYDDNPFLLIQDAKRLGFGLALLEGAIRATQVTLGECPLNGMKDIIARIGAKR